MRTHIGNDDSLNRQNLQSVFGHFREPSFWLSSLLFALFSSITIVLVWGSDRSMGYGDEGIYLLAARYPGDFKETVSSFYLYFNFLFRVVDYDPQHYRLLAVALVYVSTFSAWFGLVCHLPALSRYQKYNLLLFMLIGASLLYQWFYMTPNYNTAIGIAIAVFSGAGLFGFSKLSSLNYSLSSGIALSLAGLAAGFATMVKVPAGISMLLLGVLLALLWRIPIRLKLLGMVSVIGGFFLWFAIHFVFIASPNEWWASFVSGWNLYQLFGRHVPEQKYIVYLEELVLFTQAAILVFYPSHILIVAANLARFFFPGSGLVRISLKYALILAPVVALIMSLHSMAFFEESRVSEGPIPPYLVFQFAWMLLLVLMALSSSLLHQSEVTVSKGDNGFLIVLFLTALPFVGAAGTSNPIYNVPLCHAGNWFAVIYILIHRSPFTRRQMNLFARTILVAVIALYSTSQIVQGYIYKPQFISPNLLQQNMTTRLSDGHTLKLDKLSKSLIDTLRAAAHDNGFSPGGDIIAVSYTAGLVYALNGRSPGHPVFLIGSDESVAYSNEALSFADRTRAANALILLNVRPNRVSELLAYAGLEFPEKYERIAFIEKPDAEFSLWKPKFVNVR